MGIAATQRPLEQGSHRHVQGSETGERVSETARGGLGNENAHDGRVSGSARGGRASETGRDEESENARVGLAIGTAHAEGCGRGHAEESGNATDDAGTDCESCRRHRTGCRSCAPSAHSGHT